MLFSSNPCMYVILYQGPRSNFEIGEGGGGTISHSILGGTKHFFLKYWGGGGVRRSRRVCSATVNCLLSILTEAEQKRI